MSWIRVLLWLLPRRLRSSRVLLAIVSFGILATVTLMAVGAIYSHAIAEGGLRHTLATAPARAQDAQILVRNRPLGPGDYQNLAAIVEELTESRLRHILQNTQRFGRAQPDLPLLAAPEDTDPPFGGPVGQPFFLTGFEEHSRIVQGRWPQAPPAHLDTGLELEVVVGRETASDMGFELDSQAVVLPFPTDPSERIILTIVGFAEPEDPDAEYWMGMSSAYFSAQAGGFSEPVRVPIYISEEDFFRGLGTRYPSLVGDFGWLLFLDTGLLDAGGVEPTRDAITGLEAGISKRFPRSFVISGLDRILADYQRDLTHARVPLFLFISLVVLVILYFLALVTGLLARTRGDEASQLRSRGASTVQLTGVLAFAEGAVVLLSILLGPFLALGIVRFLLLRTIDPAGNGGPISVGVSADAFLMGAIGGALSLVVLLASVARLARLGIVESLYLRARPPSVPFFQRYYIDLLILVGAVLLWWQIRGREGFVERDVLSGALEGDISLRLGPLLVLLAAALLVLRLLPPLVKAVSWVGNRLAPAWVAFTLSRMARDPLPHGSLAIILMLAFTLGIFGAMFQSTLSRGQREQALHEVGGDLVIRGASLSGSAQGGLAGIPGVRTVSPMGRDSVTVIGGLPGARADLLTVNPASLPQAAWFRDDFAGKSLSDLLKPLAESPQDMPRGIALPEDAEQIGVWVDFSWLLSQGFSRRTVSLWARVADADGRHHSLLLDDPPQPHPDQRDSQAQGWTYLEAPLPGDQRSPGQPPFSLVSMFITAGSISRIPSGSIGLDDVTVRGPTTPSQGIVVEGHEDPGPAASIWVTLPNEGVPDALERTPQAAREGRFGLTFSWEESLTDGPRGVLIPAGPFPLPAIGGPAFHVGQELKVRSGRQLVPLVVRDVTEFFPTADQPRRFLLVSMDDYGQYVGRIHEGRFTPPEEFWLSLEDGIDRDETILAIRRQLPRFASVRDRDAAVQLAQRNPLAGGGWKGLTVLSVSTLTVAVVLALAAYAAAAVQAGRVDLTVVRALGFSRLQVVLLLALERIVVAVLGIAAGSAIGFWLSRWVLGFLDITASGRPLVPPLIVTVHSGLLALVFVNLVAALVATTIFAALSARRLKASEILRAGY